MPDVVSAETRSRMMSSIKGKDTAPEMLVRRLLHSRGYRYRLHHTGLPGKPDLVFPSRRAVVFLHGCFWHGHACPAYRLPQSNRAFWKEKIGRNRQRDRRAIARLTAEGWRVLVVWECATRGAGRLSDHDLAKRLVKWLDSGRRLHVISGKAISKMVFVRSRKAPRI